METEDKKPSVVAEVLRKSSMFLSLEYGLAIGAMLASILAILATVQHLFTLWNDGAGVDLLALMSGSTQFVAPISMAVASVVFGLLALVLFGRVSRTIQSSRTGYTNRLSYKALTYAGFSVLVALVIVFKVQLLSIVIASLTLIGTGVSIGDLYLFEFLPLLIATGIVGGASFFFYRIVKGVNKSRQLSLGLVGIGVALLIATIITVAVVARDTPTETRGIELDRTPSRDLLDTDSNWLQ